MREYQEDCDLFTITSSSELESSLTVLLCIRWENIKKIENLEGSVKPLKPAAGKSLKGINALFVPVHKTQMYAMVFEVTLLHHPIRCHSIRCHYLARQNYSHESEDIL